MCFISTPAGLLHDAQPVRERAEIWGFRTANFQRAKRFAKPFGRQLSDVKRITECRKVIQEDVEHSGQKTSQYLY